jgi:hypothetical protein
VLFCAPMKLWVSVGVLCSLYAFVGCGGDDNGGIGGGGGGPGDHVQQGCNADQDCDDGNKCHVARCQSHVCANPAKECPAQDECNAGVCNPDDGSCSTDTSNEGGNCLTQQAQPGTCQTGACLALPTCYDPQTSYNYMDCTSTPNDDSNDPATSWSYPTTVMNDYPCAAKETGPEVAYQFTPPVEGDVTVSLKAKPKSTTDGGTPDGGATGPKPDLDLIILDGSCTAQATCANPQLPGGGYQGVTAGSGDEKVTFHAVTGHTYYLVVDGHDGATGDYTLSVDSCGACNAATATKIACNQSMTVSGDTSKGQSLLSSYTCAAGASSQMLTLGGKEQTFQFTGSAPYSVTVKATAQIVNASGAATLLALPSTQGACDPAACAGAAATTNGAATLPFNATPDFSDTFSYWLVVDTASSDATYGLSLTCQPYCSNYFGDYVDCTYKTVTGSNDQYGSTNDVAQWGPASAACGAMTNLTGAEYVYLFHKTTTTNMPKYRFTLTASTSNKHLALVILDAGTTNPASCDPVVNCASTAAATVAATTTKLASTGTYTAASPGTTDGGTKGKTATVDLTTGTLAEHYYWVIVDGVKGDVSDYSLTLESGCP